MANPSVVVLATYPIVRPRHGGQIRTKALVDAYRADGFDASHLAVYEQGAYPFEAVASHDVAFPTHDERWFLQGRNIPLTNDLRSGLFAASSEEAYQKILKSLPKKVAVFHLEQPWLLPLVKRLKTEPAHAGAVVVYGSQNVEAPLREAIFRQMSIADGDQVVKAILELETEACRYAELTLAVAPTDHQTLERWGARRVLRAPNGISPWSASLKAVDAWQAKLKCRRVALFVGSAHPPNFDGFFRAFGDALGFVPPDCKIVVAGSVGPHIFEHYHQSRFNVLNLSRLEITGEIDTEQLAALKTIASVYLLPIFEGGGSNIKTAEAIYSGKQVIATEASLRGYDAYLKLPEITVANTQDEFRLSVRKALQPSAEPMAPAPGAGLRSRLLWTSCLAVVPRAVHEALEGR